MALTPAQLRRAFAGWQPGQLNDHGPITEIVDEPVPPEVRARIEQGRKPAAVLVPLIGAETGGPLRVLLTQRTEQLRDHAGQISFPGGGLKPGEAPMAAALREAEEEIGLAAGLVDVFGELPRYYTGTGFDVAPLIGFVAAEAQLTPDVGEVAAIFSVPLDFLVDPRNFRRETCFYRGAWRSFLTVPWAGHYIWGATAGMLAQLARILHGVPADA